jgi:putative addiction module component (TIGR02574 family)
MIRTDFASKLRTVELPRTIRREPSGDRPMSDTPKPIDCEEPGVGQPATSDGDPEDSMCAGDDSLPLCESQKQDLLRRLVLYNENPSLGSSWKEVKARLEESHQSKDTSET